MFKLPSSLGQDLLSPGRDGRSKVGQSDVTKLIDMKNTRGLRPAMEKLRSESKLFHRSRDLAELSVFPTLLAA